MLLDFIATASAAALTAELTGRPLAERLPALDACVGFALQRTEHELITLLAKGRPEQMASLHWGHRELLQTFEQRFGLPAGLLVDRDSPPAELFSLEPTYANPELAFAHELRRARQAKGLTLRQLADAVSGHLQRLQSMEKGHHLPGHYRESRARVHALALILDSPDLLLAFRASSEFWDRTRPGAKAKDIVYADYASTEHAAQIAALLRWEDRRTGVPRGGRRNSAGKLKASSKKKNRQYLAQSLAYWQLPPGGPYERLRGLGRPASEVSLLDLGDETQFRGTVEWFHARNGREHCAKSEAALFGKIQDYFAPGYGYFNKNSEELASTLPRASLERCPGSGRRAPTVPGRPAARMPSASGRAATRPSAGSAP